MKVKIEDIANKAGVSIATVSHVINKTRYVSEELSESVLKAVDELGYIPRGRKPGDNKRVGNLSEIAYLFPKMESSLYMSLGTQLSRLFGEAGYTLCSYLSNDNVPEERFILNNILSNRRIAGIVLVPASVKASAYKKLIHSRVPFVLLERTVDSLEVGSVVSDSVSAIFKGTNHLIRNGHRKIGILVGGKDRSHTDDRVSGYKLAFENNHIPFDKEMVFFSDASRAFTAGILEELPPDNFPTAFIAAGNTHTLELIRAMRAAGYEYPDDISIVGYGDDDWCDISSPPLTTLCQNIDIMAEEVTKLLLSKIEGKAGDPQKISVAVDLIIRESTRSLERGPSGEVAVYPEQIIPTEEEIEYLRFKRFKIGISFHYSGTEWIRLHERAIRDVMEKFGIDIAAVVEARFDPQLQVAQLDGLMMQNLDAIISLPADEDVTISKYKEIAKRTKLIFIGIVPESFKKDDYSTIVSVNEHENGQNAGRILGECFKGRDHVKIGMLNHGAPFAVTRRRDNAAEQVFIENYPNVEIAGKVNFYRHEDSYNACKKLMKTYPEIEGLYVSWQLPALGAIRALKDLNRKDVLISTVDLDYEIASFLARGEYICGISAQKPYEEGEAAAYATANALIGKDIYRFVGLRPIIVNRNNLSKTWIDIMHAELPDFIKESKS